MKKLTILLFLISSTVFGQDIISTSAGAVKISPILHGTVVFEFNGKTIYVDPYGGASAFEGQKKPDLVLITDIHGDHHSQETLDGLDLSMATIVAPKAVSEKLPIGKSKGIITINNDETKMIEGVSVHALPMYNLPETEDSRHPKGRGNGYVLTMGDKKFYLSGDTEDIPEMRALTDIDVAFVCMNLPYTMDVDQAADAVAEFKPTIVYPYHYRGTEGLSDVDKFKSLVNSVAPGVDVRLRNWYPSN
ncbi:MBL fold metallo-hydrolase [Algoriphagus pacificus]|uniref:MBL fold metallo-hydrolase n=1 Tax=Algoriphagus pacificus TaxID=2811234 RepID=A0ABS3CMZ3_9BACT|nr:MBL fold metallo-hydrolase [Algoriphagus pacificus]MBN7817874.1 MBL fold metallo-hydrolase [Algoriphagus pacificus]